MNITIEGKSQNRFSSLSGLVRVFFLLLENGNLSATSDTDFPVQKPEFSLALCWHQSHQEREMHYLCFVLLSA